MRRVATIVLAAVMLPAVAADSPADAKPPAIPGPPFSLGGLIPAPGQERQLPTYEDFKRSTAMSAAEAAALAKFAARSNRGNCYFIRQVNRNLQTPKDKPELIKLADGVAAPIANSASNCLTDSIVRKAVAE